MNFSGTGIPLAPSDLRLAASLLGCQLAAVLAVDKVESGSLGGFLRDGTKRPVILFEAHRFHKLTNGAFSASNPNVSSSFWNRALYRGGAAEYGRLAEAMGLNMAAALMSASWGRFQILGENYKACGFTSVVEFVNRQLVSEGEHLTSFSNFVISKKLDKALVACDFAAFALGYNGTAYRENKYDTKLAAAFLEAGGVMPNRQAIVLKIGDTGTRVAQLQKELNLTGARIVADGLFGRATQIAVEKFQAGEGLVADGVYGPRTAATLTTYIGAALR